MKLLVINGPNLNLLGIREPGVYGTASYAELERFVKDAAQKLGCEADMLQSNSEGAIIDALHAAMGKYDAVVINPGAYTHYSHAIADAIKGTSLAAIEVHISNVHAREEFRRNSVIAPVCIGQISGLGFEGYRAAMAFFLNTSI